MNNYQFTGTPGPWSIGHTNINQTASGITTYARLCKQLNYANKEGIITIFASEIQQEMDDLKQSLGAFCCVFMEDVEMFNMIYDEVQPIPEFNTQQ